MNRYGHYRATESYSPYVKEGEFVDDDFEEEPSVFPELTEKEIKESYEKDRQVVSRVIELAEAFQHLETQEEKESFIKSHDYLLEGVLKFGTVYPWKEMLPQSVTERIRVLQFFDESYTSLRSVGKADAGEFERLLAKFNSSDASALVARFSEAIMIRRDVWHELPSFERMKMVIQDIFGAPRVEKMSQQDITEHYEDLSNNEDLDDVYRDEQTKDQFRELYARSTPRADGSFEADLSQGTRGLFDTYGRLLAVIDGDQEKTLSEALSGVVSGGLEQREAMVSDVASAMDLRLREGIEEDYGISFSDLTLREQVWFTGALRHLDEASEERVMNLSRVFGTDFARSFLSAEFGDEFQEYILKIGEVLPEDVARQVFQTYAQISELAQTEAGKLLEDFFVKGKGQPVDATKIEMELLKRAKGLIEEFAREAMASKATGEKPNSEGLLTKLEQANTDTVLFTSIFKSVFEGGKDVAFEDLRGVEFSAESPQRLSEEEKKEMMAYSEMNWKEIPSMSAFIQENLRKKLDTPSDNTKFYTLKKDGKIIGFRRIDELPDGSIYAGSLNVAPDYRGSKIGEAILAKTIDRFAVDHVIHANVYPDSIVGTSYVEKFGYVITGVEEVSLPGGGKEYGFTILRDDSINPNYLSRRSKTPSSEHHAYDLKTDRQRLLDDVALAEKNGMVVTRFWADKGNPSMRHLVFEDRVQEQEQKKVG